MSDDKLHTMAKRLAETVTATDNHARYLNQAEQRLLARAYLTLLNEKTLCGVEMHIPELAEGEARRLEIETAPPFDDCRHCQHLGERCARNHGIADIIPASMAKEEGA